jgi:hypothetical protein
MSRLVLPIMLTLATAAAPGRGGESIGWRGNGSGVHLGVDPPLRWAVVGLAYALCGRMAPAQDESPLKDSPSLSVAAAPAPPAGLAALYPGDEGLERDPRVLFVEDFETGGLDEIGARWGDRQVAAARMELVPDRHAASPGERSLFIGIGRPDALQPGCCGGHLYTHTRAVDQMHVRFYVKFHEKHGYMHHHVFLIADREATPWPKGWAGKKPSGDYHFSTAIEPRTDWGKIPPPGAWNFYTYWQEMKPDGLGHYWGNQFPAGTDVIPRGQWICVEAMVKANSSPEKADGEQAFWIDGKPVGGFQGIRWRSTNKLKLTAAIRTISCSFDGLLWAVCHSTVGFRTIAILPARPRSGRAPRSALGQEGSPALLVLGPVLAVDRSHQRLDLVNRGQLFHHQHPHHSSQIKFQLVILALQRLQSLLDGGRHSRSRSKLTFQTVQLRLLVREVHLLTDITE